MSCSFISSTPITPPEKTTTSKMKTDLFVFCVTILVMSTMLTVVVDAGEKGKNVIIIAGGGKKCCKCEHKEEVVHHGWDMGDHWGDMFRKRRSIINEPIPST